MREDNRTQGDIWIRLERDDLEVETEAVDLIAWIEGLSLGSEDEPTVTFLAHKVSEELGSSENIWNISVKRLRALCDAAEAMHKVGVQQFDEHEGSAK